MNPLEELKGMDPSHVLALVKKCGGLENVKAILRGEKEVILKDLLPVLFDKSGRRIPNKIKSDIFDIGVNPICVQRPKLWEIADLDHRLSLLHESLGFKTGVDQFQLLKKSSDLLVSIETDRQIANIEKGVSLPIIIPRMNSADLGGELGSYLTGMQRSCRNVSKSILFENKINDSSLDKVGFVDGSRYEQLIERLKDGPVVGIYFPMALQGYSVDACREQMQTLPDGFVLSGLDAVIAAIMYPEMFWNAIPDLVLNLPALYYESKKSSFNFYFSKQKWEFGLLSFLYVAYGSRTSGLLYIG